MYRRRAKISKATYKIDYGTKVKSVSRFKASLVHDIIRVILGQLALELVCRGVEGCPPRQVGDPAMNAERSQEAPRALKSIKRAPPPGTKPMQPRLTQFNPIESGYCQPRLILCRIIQFHDV